MLLTASLMGVSLGSGARSVLSPAPGLRLVFTMRLLSDMTFISEMEVAVLSRGRRVNRVVTEGGAGAGAGAGTLGAELGPGGWNSG